MINYEQISFSELQKIQKKYGVNLSAYEYGKIFNNPDFESQSCNTIVAGTVNTGKTHQSLLYAKDMASFRFENGKSVQNRPIVIINHTNNRSYRHVPIIGIDWLNYRLDAVNFPMVQVCPRTEEEIDLVLQLIIHVARNMVFVFDDCATIFYGNLSDNQKGVVKTPKNNANDMIYQFHSFAEVTPMLLLNSSVAMVKQTMETKLKEKVPNAEFIKILSEEVRQENKIRPDGKNWATRVFLMMDSKVAVMIDKYNVNSDEIRSRINLNGFNVGEGQFWYEFNADQYFEGRI